MLWGLGIRHPSEVAKLEERLTTAGFPTIDISGIEAAQACLRSLARCTLVREESRKLRAVMARAPRLHPAWWHRVPACIEFA